MGKPLRVGLVGAGQISGAYLETLPRLGNVTLTTIADLDRARAVAVAARLSADLLEYAENWLARLAKELK